ncbi:hypothetical protein ABH897_001992 [Paenibacillus sp. RC73]
MKKLTMLSLLALSLINFGNLDNIVVNTFGHGNGNYSTFGHGNGH